ncbi:MAG: LlaJI family restriction endonuclease [Hungatella sp.]|nr:LlaJI family restriction endonuclease [Hungatella sp.]
MISMFLREQKRYTQKDLCDKFKCSEEKVVPIIRKLKEFGVLKAVKASDPQRDMSDLMDQDVEVADVEAGEKEYLYVFTFVGVIVVAGRVLKCYPKYLLSTKEPREELCQILKVLERYNSKEQIIRMFNDSSESSSFNLLAVLLFLIQDYYENGVYSNTEDIIESNGFGEILWDKTINETFTLLSNNRPYYIDLRTKRRVRNDFDYFKRLHECILTKASKEMKDADLLDLFQITEINLTDEELDEFGEAQYILYRIENELSTQFNTRKQLILKTLYAYIDHSGSLYDTDCLSLFGTNSFNLVWESICVDIMDNQLDNQLGILNLPIPLKPEYDRDRKLIDLIEKPLWSAAGKRAGDTLIPDLVTISEDQFIIFDAKYYIVRLEPGITPKGQPGIESVTKQYLYQLAYQKFIMDHGFAEVKNCFLMPTENKEIGIRGEASMEMLSNLGLQSIKVRLIPAAMAYEYYLSGRKMDIRLLEL